MKHRVVAVTNFIAVAAGCLLLYWIFSFIIIEAFGLRVFRQNSAQLFSLSIFGLVAVLAATLMLSLMCNLARLADAAEMFAVPKSKTDVRLSTRSLALLACTPFLLIPVALYAGDYYSTHNRKQRLLETAEMLSHSQAEILKSLAPYKFSLPYLKTSSELLEVLRNQRESFPALSMIVADEIHGELRLLSFAANHFRWNSKLLPNRVDYLYATSAQERAYLEAALRGDTEEPLFSAYDGNYELYFPVSTTSGRFVLHLQQYANYGK